ncbi:hypothetical protein CTI12_AA410760 [Artemisia annua]|uniref:Uncharacterized protein n=1 Tax=Artemisia annua TaxID=35608 RepID=A0A2U1KZR2_ARTAN|nr:hypothetical protein CTI12_AA410760 [Artemisia annua]
MDSIKCSGSNPYWLLLQGVCYIGKHQTKRQEMLRKCPATKFSIPNTWTLDNDVTLVFGKYTQGFGYFGDVQVQAQRNEDLEELRELSSGRFGIVYHGKWRGTYVAIKRIKKSCFATQSSDQHYDCGLEQGGGGRFSRIREVDNNGSWLGIQRHLL